MGLHMPNRPDAAPGIPKGRVAPGNGPETRIGSGDPGAVAQTEAAQRTCGVPGSHARARFACTSTPMSNVHRRIGNGLRRTALESGVWKCGSVEVVRFLDGRVVHAPDGVLEALDPAPDGCDGGGLMAGSRRLRMPCPALFERRRVPMMECVEYLGAVERWPTPSSRFAPSIFAASRSEGGLRTTTGAFRGIYGPQDRV